VLVGQWLGLMIKVAVAAELGLRSTACLVAGPHCMCNYRSTCCWLSAVLLQVAGSASGISAFQMDIKVEGITLDIMKKV
jgi:hypothetical protein